MMNSIFKEIKSLSVLYWIPLISAVLFLYESLYTRFISAILYNSYVFIIISLSVVGYGLGSSLYIRLIKKHNEKINNQKTHLILLASLFLSIFLILAIIYLSPFISFWIYLIPVSIPFIIAGFIFSGYYNNNTSKSPLIFTLDLIGAVIGLLGGFLLMNTIGIIETTLLIGILSMILFMIYVLKYKKKLVVLPVFLSVILLLVLFNQESKTWVNNNFNGFYSSPFTSFERFAQGGQKANIIATKWDAYSRTDVLDVGMESKTRTVTIDGAANASMVKVEEGSDEHMYLKDQIDFLPYIIRSPENAAIIGAGGGRDILQALHGGVTSVDAIEINRSSIDITNEMKEYNGSIFEDDRVNIRITDGRSFIKKSEIDYDLIFLSMVMTGISQSASLVTAETYIYTKEAIATYIDKLSTDGLLTFVSHDTQDMIKILRTIRNVLMEDGFSGEEIKKRTMVVGNPMAHGREVMLHNPVIVYSPKEFSNDEVLKAKRFINRISVVPLLLKDTPEVEIIRSVINNDSLDLSFNFAPATDEKPYFYHLSKGLPSSLSTIMIISIFITFLLWSKKIVRYKLFKKAAYFSLSGMAFMMVEVILIQKMTLILGHATLAFIFMISVILTGAGMGSIVSSSKLKLEKWASLISGLLLISGALILLIFKNELLAAPLYMRLWMIGIYFFITSFFQGIVFPAAIKHTKEHTPIYYGINSSFSLIGSVSALLLIFLFGSTIAMLIGSSLYIVLFIIKPYTIGKNEGE